MDVVVVISGHLRNTQSSDVGGTQPWRDAAHAALVSERADRFPALAGLARPRAHTPRQTRDFGLRCLLHGLEAHLDAAGGKTA